MGQTQMVDIGSYTILKQALTELEELKNNKIVIDKEDTERYLSMFERQVLKQIVKEIEDKKKLYSLDRQFEGE